MNCIQTYSDDYGICSFFESKIRKARKQYKCCECGESINIGDDYEYFRGCWNGDFETYRICKVCNNIRKDLFCGAFLFGNMWDEIKEAMCNHLIENGIARYDDSWLGI